MHFCYLSFDLIICLQNELILVGVLDVIYETVSTLLRGQVDKRTMLDNLELVLLTIDEAVINYIA